MIGNKLHTEADYVGHGPDPIVFTRYYNSDPRVRAGSLGAKWRHSYDRELVVDGTTATLYRPDGSVMAFTKNADTWMASSDHTATLRASAGAFEASFESGSVEKYDEQGRLTEVGDANGNWHSVTRDEKGRISGIENEFGDLLRIVYQDTYSYAESIMASGPVAYWRLGEASGSVAGDEQSLYEGSYEGTPSLGVAGLVPGTANTAVAFSSDYVSGTGVPLGSGDIDEFSIEAWIEPGSGGGGAQVIWEQRDPTTLASNASLSLAAGRVQFDKYPPAYSQIRSNAVLSVGSIYHVVYVESGASRSIYINGVLDASNSTSEVFTGAAPSKWSIGGRADNGAWEFAGVIDEVAVYTYALSEAEIGTHYDASVDVHGVAYIEDRAGRRWGYEYGEFGELLSVINPDGTFRKLHYRSSSEGQLLTGVTDERGTRIVDYEYDLGSNAARVSSRADGVNRRDLHYHPDGTRIVTDSLGRVKTYNTKKSLGEILPIRVNR